MNSIFFKACFRVVIDVLAMAVVFGLLFSLGGLIALCLTGDIDCLIIMGGMGLLLGTCLGFKNTLSAKLAGETRVATPVSIHTHEDPDEERICELGNVYARPDATHEDLKRLAICLKSWAATQPDSVRVTGLDCMLDGQYPLPFDRQYNPVRPPWETHSLVISALESDIDGVMDSLRRIVPLELGSVGGPNFG